MDEFPTVAVIDDELGSRQSLRMILKDEFNVLSFGSVAEALRVALAAPRGIDLIFVDIRMPAQGHESGDRGRDHNRFPQCGDRHRRDEGRCFRLPGQAL